jgi:hypothetical protein
MARAGALHHHERDYRLDFAADELNLYSVDFLDLRTDPD